MAALREGTWPKAKKTLTLRYELAPPGKHTIAASEIDVRRRRRRAARKKSAPRIGGRQRARSARSAPPAPIWPSLAR